MLERKWRKERTEISKQLLRAQSRSVSSLIDEAKVLYYKARIQDGSDADLFNVVNELLGKQSVSPLPDHVNAVTLASDFSNFFSEKIAKIRRKLDDSRGEGDSVSQVQDSNVLNCLDSFRPVTTDEVKRLVLSLPSKSCNIDPIPTWLLKKCLDVLLPVITRIINKSLECGEVPSSLKFAMVKPLLKKLSLDKDVLGNYRPVSNLAYLSKLIERVVAMRLNDHMSFHGMFDPNQSAYRKGHSTETFLLKVCDDMLRAMDEGKEGILILLDLSSAFDTVDHDILIERLETRIGLSGTVLQWFTSYLSGRKQCILVQGSESDHVPLLYGVPQGSVLGPILFTIYSPPLGDNEVMRGTLPALHMTTSLWTPFAVVPRKKELK